MQVIRIYTGDDEQTHFEELDVEAFRAIYEPGRRAHRL
jgi:hypothetical protein